MALTAKDKAWITATFKRVVEEVLQDMVDGHAEAVGGYDGAHEYKDDDWADDGKQRIGFEHPTTGGIQKTVK